MVVRIADEAQRGALHRDIGMAILHLGDGDLRRDVLLVVHHPQVQALRLAVHRGDGQRLPVHGNVFVMVGQISMTGIDGGEHHIQRL